MGFKSILQFLNDNFGQVSEPLVPYLKSEPYANIFQRFQDILFCLFYIVICLKTRCVLQRIICYCLICGVFFQHSGS